MGTSKMFIRLDKQISNFFEFYCRKMFLNKFIIKSKN